MRCAVFWCGRMMGVICTGETYKDKVKLTFAKGAALEYPSRLFNASLDGNTRRAIDVREGDTIDAEAFKTLLRAAVALNTIPPQPPSSRGREQQQPRGIEAERGESGGHRS